MTDRQGQVLETFLGQAVSRKISKNFRLIMTEEDAERFDGGGAGVTFSTRFQRYLDEAATVPLDYPVPFAATLFVLPCENFRAVCGGLFDRGMRGIRNLPDDRYFPKALAVDSEWFAKGFQEDNISVRTGMLHEIAHVIHGAFFADMPVPVAEGFAEAFPLYVLGLEKEYPEHAKAVAEMPPQGIMTYAQIKERGMFEPGEGGTARVKTQFRRAYISSYLLMRGFLQRWTDRQDGNAKTSLRPFMNEMAEISKRPGEKERLAAMAGLIRLAPPEMAESGMLQAEAQEAVRKTWKEMQNPRATIAMHQEKTMGR